jgi:hypothetical protein
MAVLNARQQELYTIYDGVVARTYTPYTYKFTEANAPIFSGTTRIHVEDALAELVEASVFDRDSAIPAIVSQGHTRISITPPLLGNKKPISALDGISKGVGQAVVVIGGQTVDSTKYEITKKLTELKAGIENGKGNMAGEVFLTSAIASEGLNFDVGNLSAKGNVTVTPANGETIATTIVKMARTFFKNKGRVPSISIGDAVADQLISEINSATGKSKRGDYSMVANTAEGQKGFSVMIDTMNIPLEVLAPVNAFKGSVINTDAKIILHSPDTLVMGYAVLETVDGNDLPLLVKGAVVTGYGEVNKVNGRTSVHAYSAPVPMIVDNNLIERWDLVIAS